MTTSAENGRKGGQPAMHTPPVVSPQAWEAARQQLLVKEKAQTRARDALAAERRRMPWMAVETAYAFEGPAGKASLLDLFDGRRQLIVYRAFFEPGVFGWPDHACRGCSMVADQVAHVAHLNARDTTLVFVSRAPQADIARLKARMGWEMPWFTITDSFDADFGVDEWHGTNVFYRDGDRVFRTYFINNRGDEQMGTALELPRHHAAGPAGGLGGLARGLSSDPDLQVVELARQLRRRRSARQEVGRGVGRRRGGVPNQKKGGKALSQARRCRLLQPLPAWGERSARSCAPGEGPAHTHELAARAPLTPPPPRKRRACPDLIGGSRPSERPRTASIPTGRVRRSRRLLSRTSAVAGLQVILAIAS